MSKDVDQSLAWFEQFASSVTPQYDPNGMAMLNFAHLLGSWQVGGLVTYAQPIANPQIFQRFYNSSVAHTMAITTYGAVAKLNAAVTPSGTRTLWVTFSHINSAAFMKVVLDLAAQTSASMPLLSGLGLIFQPLWASPRAASFSRSGGNALGLENHNDDIVIVQISFTYVTASQDARIKTAALNLVENAKARAQQMRVYSPYIYANYAADFQDVIGGYGEKNREIMISIAQKYDPYQLFQKQVPGGFKLKPATANSAGPNLSPFPTAPTAPYPASPYPAAPYPAAPYMPSPYQSAAPSSFQPYPLYLSTPAAPGPSARPSGPPLPYYQGSESVPREFPRPNQSSSSAGIPARPRASNGP
jgi:hypothetical protein